MQIRFNPPVDSVGTRLKKVRKLRNMTQHDLAALSGVQQPSISKIERGDIQRPVELFELARALRCNPDWLSKGVGEMDLEDAANAPSNISAALNTLHDRITSVKGVVRAQTIAALRYFLEHPEEWRQVAEQIDGSPAKGVGRTSVDRNPPGDRHPGDEAA